MFGSNAEDEDANVTDMKEEQEDNSIDIDWKSVLTGQEDVLFSCSGAEEDRELILTKNRVIVRIRSRGSSHPIGGCDISFSKKGDLFRTYVSNSSRPKGLKIEKSEFEEFWRVFTSQLDER